MTGKLLIVEDEPDLSALLASTLEDAGYRTLAVGTGGEALEALKTEHPDIALIDLMLPDRPGTEVCRHIRRSSTHGEMGIIVVTAKTDEIDRVVCFELGVDDYVTKPFSLRELTLRVEAVRRRVSAGLPGGGETEAIMEVGPIAVDVDRRRVTINGEAVDLTYLEFELLRVFVERCGRVQSRDRLINDVWGRDAKVTSRTVDTHVKRLRQKIESARDMIETVRGVGYRFNSV